MFIPSPITSMFESLTVPGLINSVSLNQSAESRFSTMDQIKTQAIGQLTLGQMTNQEIRWLKPHKIQNFNQSCSIAG